MASVANGGGGGGGGGGVCGGGGDLKKSVDEKMSVKKKVCSWQKDLKN